MSLNPNDSNSEKLLLDALDGGINYFDTADMYQKGFNEILLGRVFRGKRDDVILATKVGNQWRADGSGWDWNPSKKHILTSIDKSLERLQTDHIDLYQLHGGTINDPIDDIIEIFELLKSSGKIRYYGISSIRPNVIREYIKKSGTVSVMMQYSILDRRPEEEMLPLLDEKQIGVLARGSIAKGLLVSKPAEPYLNYSAEEVSKAAEAVKSVSDINHPSLETAIQFVLQHQAVSSAVVGIRTEIQLKEILGIDLSVTPRSGQMESLREILQANKYTDHR